MDAVDIVMALGCLIILVGAFVLGMNCESSMTSYKEEEAIREQHIKYHKDHPLAFNYYCSWCTHEHIKENKDHEESVASSNHSNGLATGMLVGTMISRR
jgi:hypothetical protein